MHIQNRYKIFPFHEMNILIKIIVAYFNTNQPSYSITNAVIYTMYLAYKY